MSHGQQSSGTGFFWNNSTSTESTLPCLVTARHVGEGAQEIKTWLLRAGKDGEPLLGNALEVNLPPVDKWVFYKNADIDVAVVPIGPLLNEYASRGEHFAFKPVGANLSIPDDQLDDYDAVEAVSFVGYPNGLYDTASYLPIIRQGTTASPIHLHWNGKPQFLVDASVFPGSSGSPVFALSEGTYRTRQALTVGSRLAFVGLMSAVQIQMDTTGELLTASPAVMTRQLMDLGVVQRWTAVQETVDMAVGKAP